MFSHYNGRKRGPKDAPNGLKFKLLAVVARRGLACRRELERAYGLTSSGVLYHLKDLTDLEAGYLIPLEERPRSPYQRYALPIEAIEPELAETIAEPFMALIAEGAGRPELLPYLKAVWAFVAWGLSKPEGSLRELARRASRALGLGFKFTLGLLELLTARGPGDNGLIIKLPHLRCPYGIWVAYPWPVEQPEHHHPPGFRGHLYDKDGQSSLLEYLYPTKPLGPTIRDLWPGLAEALGLTKGTLLEYWVPSEPIGPTIEKLWPQIAPYLGLGPPG